MANIVVSSLISDTTVANTVMNGLGTEGKWYEFSFDYKNIDRHLVMAGIQTASSGAGSLVNDPSTSKALSTFVQGSLMTLYDYSRGNSLQDSYLSNMNWDGMMTNMSDLGNQMGQMMRAGMQNDKAKHENEQAGKETSNANHDPFGMADTMLGGILLSLGGALGQTQRQITDKIAGSALGSAVGELYSGSMLDTAVSGVSDGFNYARNTINSGINKVKNWGMTALNGVKDFAVDTYERAGNWVNDRGFYTDNKIKELYKQHLMNQENKILMASNGGSMSDVGNPAEMLAWKAAHEQSMFNDKYGEFFDSWGSEFGGDVAMEIAMGSAMKEMARQERQAQIEAMQKEQMKTENFRVHDFVSAMVKGETGNYYDEDIQEKMSEMCSQFGVKTAEELNGILKVMPESSRYALAMDGMNTTQQRGFLRSFGVAQGLQSGDIRVGDDGYYQGNQKVAGKWDNIRNQVRHDPYLGYTKEPTFYKSAKVELGGLAGIVIGSLGASLELALFKEYSAIDGEATDNYGIQFNFINSTGAGTHREIDPSNLSGDNELFEVIEDGDEYASYKKIKYPQNVLALAGGPEFGVYRNYKDENLSIAMESYLGYTDNYYFSPFLDATGFTFSHTPNNEWIGGSVSTGVVVGAGRTKTTNIISYDSSGGVKDFWGFFN